MAEYVSKHLLTDEQAILSLTQEKPSLGRRILQWLDSLIAKLGNKVSQERTFLLNARNLYAKALFQTQGSFNADTTTSMPGDTTASTTADGTVKAKEKHRSDENGVAADMDVEALRQRAREMYEQGKLSESEFDEEMELIDQLEEESTGYDENNTTKDGDVKFAIHEIGNTGKFYVQADRQVITGDDPNLWGKQIENYINEQIRKEQDIAIPTPDGHVLLLTGRSAYKLKDNHIASIQKKVEAFLSDEEYALKGRAATHIDELIQVARFNGYEADLNNKHENDIGEDGFNYFEAFFRDFDGRYYLVPFSAGINAQEETVYSIGKIRQRRFPANTGSSSQKEALKNGRKPSKDIIYTSKSKSQEVKTAVQLAYEKALNKKKTNEQFSISDQVNKQDVVSDLREILRRGGDPAELRRYVENMERGTESTAEIDSTDSQDAEVQEILRAAREQNISVDEYLRRNWEQYEYDGQLNPAARTALDQEKGNVQYSVSDSNQKYDYTKSFAEQVDDYKAGLIPEGDTLLIGATPEVYQSVGFNALPMTINTTHVDYALNGTKDADHYLGEILLKQLPDKMKNPVAVFTSQTRTGTSVVALLPFEINGKQIIAPVAVDGFSRQNGIRIDSNSITSLFGKSNAVTKLLYDAAVEESEGNFSLLYINKKEAVTLLQRAGLQLPSGLKHHDGFIHSIRESGSPVKPKFLSVTETQQFKRWFGDWQKHPQNASKIVNQDGSPMVMHHGSPAQFTAFDKKKARSSGQYGSGFYFTNSQSHANTYGHEYSVYLNIRNPLESGRTEVSRGQVETFLNAVAENEDYSIENYGTYDIDTIVESIMGNIDTVDAFKLIQDVNLTAIGDMVEAVELFNQVNNTKFDGIVTATETVAFYPEQIKSATDNIGTFDGSNPDIRYSISEDQSAEQSETTGEEMSEDPRSNLPRKAQDFLKRAENKLLNDLGEKLSVPKFARREYLRPIVQEISNEYLRTGWR